LFNKENFENFNFIIESIIKVVAVFFGGSVFAFSMVMLGVSSASLSNLYYKSRAIDFVDYLFESFLNKKEIDREYKNKTLRSKSLSLSQELFNSGELCWAVGISLGLSTSLIVLIGL
jgi:hypothetical protein